MKILFVGIPVNAGVLYVTFGPGSVALFKKLFTQMTGYAFLFGGAFFALLHFLPFLRKYLFGMGGVLLTGAILCMVFAYRAAGKEQKEASFVKVKLPDGQNRVQTFTGLVDTGNGLREPISGQPVCLMEKENFEKLYPEGLPGLRMIPFRSVGCSKGILPGYPVAELTIEADGEKISPGQVYIGVSENILSVQGNYQILLHPALLKKM